MHGVLVVDKPRGPTSHDVVARLRRVLRDRHIGHAGTLDPMATGVLVVAVGEGTKLVPYLTGSDKIYETEVVLGLATDTLDAEGQVTERAEVPSAALDDAVIGAALDAERARTSQVPPVFSAIHVAGVRSHVLARAGDAPELAPRDVAVRALALLGRGRDEATGAPTLRLRLEVAKGYYVRAFARDLAARLGTVAHLCALRRVASGAFDLGDAVSLDAPPEELRARALPVVSAATKVLPEVRVDAAGEADARVGRALAVARVVGAEALAGGAFCALVAEDGALLAIARRDEDAVRVVRGMRSAT